MQHSKDNSLYAICLTKGSGLLLNFYSAVYRMHDGGIYSSESEFKQRYFSYLNINEIIQKVAGCNTANLRTIRDGLLRMSFRHCPSQKSKVYFNLVLEGYKIFGWRTTLGYVLKKYKGEPF